METYAKSLRQSYEVRSIANFARFEGRNEGFMEGEKRGRMEIARKLLQNGMVVDEILSITSLTPEQMKELLN